MAKYKIWQDYRVYLVGVVSVFSVLGFLANLAGMEAGSDGDKECIDCWSEITINSTFWEIKVENAGDRDIVFKKRSRSRTLWVNLDKIEELVTTDPQVKVEILVPAIKRTSTVNHEEYGYLRPLKDGDTLIHRNKLSRTAPSRIILHGYNVTTEVKWTFEISDSLMEDIDIDPKWRGVLVRKMKRCRTVNVTVPVYEEVEKTRNVFGWIPIYHPTNDTNNFVWGINGTEKFTDSVFAWNETKKELVCDRDFGVMRIGNRFVNYREHGYECGQTRNRFLYCDRISDDGNGNGFVESGESFCKVDVFTGRSECELSSKDFKRVEIV